ncbi:hypothetical protein [Paenibacillus hunanensis]|nr:hypothetical protein [Paenibacillus hunanensis]
MANESSLPASWLSRYTVQPYLYRRIPCRSNGACEVASTAVKPVQDSYRL